VKKVTIAFDIDGTLRSNTVDQAKAPVANENVRSLLILLSKCKNTRIVVWSGSGELYARQVANAIGIDHYVDKYASKNHVGQIEGVHIFAPDIVPDIAVDDIHACVLGKINLIVDEK